MAEGENVDGISKRATGLTNQWTGEMIDDAARSHYVYLRSTYVITYYSRLGLGVL